MTFAVPETIRFSLDGNICFYVIGCGGTGSYLIRDLARLISIFNAKNGTEHSMVLCDKDDVEAHNLSRQNFVGADVGSNKAEVLAKRYSIAFRTDIKFVKEYITKDNINTIIPIERHSMNVIIGCVDNNKTRHILSDHFKQGADLPCVYIDSGNEEFGGQAMFSCNRSFHHVSRQTESEYRALFYGDRMPSALETVVEHFHLSDNDRHPDEMSCAERAEHAPQNILTNIMAGDTLLGYCNLILSSNSYYREHKEERFSTREECQTFWDRQPGVVARITYFDSRTGAKSIETFTKSS